MTSRANDYRAPYSLSLPYELIHKLNTTSKDLDIPKNELVEQLLKLGLKVFLDPSVNPSSRPVKTARDVLLGLVRKVTVLEKESKGVDSSSVVLQAGMPANARPVRPGDIEPSAIEQEGPAPDSYDETFGCVSED